MFFRHVGFFCRIGIGNEGAAVYGNPFLTGIHGDCLIVPDDVNLFSYILIRHTVKMMFRADYDVIVAAKPDLFPIGKPERGWR